ncbi:hypothetical protein [Paraburkholderia sp. UCT2]|uniref:hypothetical protein n=1 Tax=Paraburkholderia sp. UCT2 TaxID=2615208 RepID=UPI001656661B|nr:hypothetical protein [Paraburkholderia sp. UCT2]MBC8726817.1 hypothetical protein [Paraburkholderia sp. UCT2]
MGKKILDYLDESKLVVRHGQQFWHLHQALKSGNEADCINALGKEYLEAGRVKTLAEGLVLAGATITAYRSNEAGERVPQRARERLKTEEATEREEAEPLAKLKGA